MSDWTAVTPLVDESEQQPQYWQEFKVGDRVRIKLSGECPYTARVNQNANGLEAIIVRIDRSRPAAHIYKVVATEEVWGWAAACELEPLSP